MAIGMVAYKYADESEKKEQNLLEEKPTDQHSLSIRGFSLRICRGLWNHTNLSRQNHEEAQF